MCVIQFLGMSTPRASPRRLSRHSLGGMQPCRLWTQNYSDSYYGYISKMSLGTREARTRAAMETFSPPGLSVPSIFSGQGPSPKYEGTASQTNVFDNDMPILGIAGGGVFFFWEVGVLKYLQENFRLKETDIIGVSAGALCAVLVACNVNLDRAVRKAYDISIEADIWNRSGGLAGIWGPLVKQWLEELLPEDAHEMCSSRVKVIATKFPRMKLEYLDNFESREDLINACMASVHIPFFLDGNGTYSYKGGQFIDGSLWDFFYGSNSGLLTLNGRSYIIDYFMDDQLEFSRMDFIKVLTFDTVQDLVKSGYSYAERTDAKGLFNEKLGQVRKGQVRKLLELMPRKIFAL